MILKEGIDYQVYSRDYLLSKCDLYSGTESDPMV